MKNKKMFLFTLVFGGFFFGAPGLTHAAIDKTTVVPCRDNNSTCWPTAFAFTPNTNKIFYVERFSGQIRVFNPDTNKDTLWATIENVAQEGEQGVLGIALDPRWPEKRWVYVYYTRSEPFENRITRWKKTTGGTFKKDKLITMTASTNHNGGVIKFGPDGKLFAGVGENSDSAQAQELSSTQGKMLRLNKNGTIPSDNPFDGSVAFFSYGHRNMYGFDFDPLDPTPGSVEIWEAENGPECNDELNFIEMGNNYGWGESASCPDTNNSGDTPVEPAYTWEETLAVTGTTFCNECELGEANEGNVLVGNWNDGTLLSLSLNSDRTGVTEVNEIYANTSGMLGVMTGNDQNIYFSDADGIYSLHK